VLFEQKLTRLCFQAKNEGRKDKGKNKKIEKI